MLYFDKIMTIIEREKNSQSMIEGIAITCLIIAAKIEEVKPPQLVDFVRYVTACSTKKVLQYEIYILTSLNWKLCIPTHIYWMDVYINNWEKYLNTTQITHLPKTSSINKDRNILELIVLDGRSLKYSPHQLSMGVFYLLLTLHQTGGKKAI